MGIEYIHGGIELLAEVKPLWEKLNLHHGSKSSHFSKRYENLTFETRQKKFLSENTSALGIDLVKDEGKYVGYCISSLNNEHTGEVESLFIEAEYRGLGVGDELMKRALNWLDEKGAQKKIIGVAEGNEEVLEFYKRYGFYKRSIILEQITN